MLFRITGSTGGLKCNRNNLNAQDKCTEKIEVGEKVVYSQERDS